MTGAVSVPAVPGTGAAGPGRRRGAGGPRRTRRHARPVHRGLAQLAGAGCRGRGGAVRAGRGPVRGRGGGLGQHVGPGRRGRRTGQPAAQPGRARLRVQHAEPGARRRAAGLGTARGGPADLADPAARRGPRRVRRRVQPAGPRGRPGDRGGDRAGRRAACTRSSCTASPARPTSWRCWCSPPRRGTGCPVPGPRAAGWRSSAASRSCSSGWGPRCSRTPRAACCSSASSCRRWGWSCCPAGCGADRAPRRGRRPACCSARSWAASRWRWCSGSSRCCSTCWARRPGLTWSTRPPTARPDPAGPRPPRSRCCSGSPASPRPRSRSSCWSPPATTGCGRPSAGSAAVSRCCS